LVQNRVSLTPESVPDGLAFTILFAEKYAACSYWALTSGRQVPWYVATPSSGFQVTPEQCDASLPQTPHRAGINVAMGDGSVRLVSPAVSPRTWFAANTPAGGEHLGKEAYCDWLP
jgi:prepilin-type processing-associated H-X9-DG protein